MTIDKNAYKAALESVAYFHQPEAGFLRLEDRDRIDFLQRQSTNDLRQVKVNRTVSTVLTSPTARIQDVFCVIDEGEWLGVVTLPGRSAETAKFLRDRIFFSDQVRVHELSAEVAQILLIGPQLDGFMEKLGLHSPKPDHMIQGRIADQPIKVLSQSILTSTGYRMLVPVSIVDVILEALDGAKATALDVETFAILRVEAGLPGPDGELVADYTPLEVQLEKLISDSKGCYTGQEVIARQITYNKVTKKLVGIRLSDPVQVGAAIKVEGKSAGRLTSVVNSPRFGPIGLGVIRSQYCDPGTAISIPREGGSVAGGEITALPFK
jgi:folate-binding protein YgfZ